MLKEYKQLYENCANSGIPNWKELDKNLLCNLYLENKGKPLENAYLSAIILNYWNLISSWYTSQQYKFATEEDCYESIIDSILYSLNKHVWLDENSSLYGDKNGPDKAINVCIKSRKGTFYQLSSKDIRKLNYNSLSLEAISENVNDDFYLEDENNKDTDYSFEIYLENYIKKKFNEKDYFLAFFLDALINSNVFVNEINNNEQIVAFSPRKTITRLKNLSLDYLDIFAHRYAVSKEIAVKQAEIIKGLTYKQFNDNIKNGLLKLTYDRDFMRWLKGC